MNLRFLFRCLSPLGTRRRVVVALIVLMWNSFAICGEIHDAARDGDLAKIKALLKGNPDLVFSQDRQGRTPLHYAALMGHKDVVELLLANKANVNAGGDGETPLGDAIMMGQTEIVELLLAHKADVKSKHGTQLTYLQDAISRLSFGVNMEIVKLLIAYKADVTVFDAAALGDWEKVNAMLIENPNLATNKNFDGRTLLYFTAKSGKKNLVELLLSYHADVNAKAPGYWTPLVYAAGGGYTDVVKLLLANKAEVNPTNNEGDTTALHAAAGMGHKDVVELLLANKAKVDATNRGGITPLHWAASGGHKDVVELLVAHHANINAVTTTDVSVNGEKWCTPLGAAEINEHKELAEWLRQHGAHE